MLLLLKIGLLFSPPEVGVADETPPWEALEVGGNPGGGYKGGRFEHTSSHKITFQAQQQKLFNTLILYSLVACLKPFF